jgi:WD40 repeat protein
MRQGVQEVRRVRRRVSALAAGIGLLAGMTVVTRAADPSARPDFKLDKTLEGHTTRVWCVAFSPDGKVLASGGNAEIGVPTELKLWDIGTGETKVTLTERATKRWVAFSPDGKHLATAEHDGTAKLRDPATGEIRHVLLGHAAGLDCAIFSPDSKTLATTSWDRTLKLWDAGEGGLLKTFAGHPDKVYTAAFSPEGKLLLSGSNDGTIRLWDVDGAVCRTTVAAHDSLVHNVAFAPNGKSFATASWDKTVKLWEAGTGKWQKTLEGHVAGVLAIAFSPDGKLLASVAMVDDNERIAGQVPKPEIKLWDAENGNEVATLTGHTNHIYGVAFSPDGKLLATASFDRTIKLWKRQ